MRHQEPPGEALLDLRCINSPLQSNWSLLSGVHLDELADKLAPVHVHRSVDGAPTPRHFIQAEVLDMRIVAPAFEDKKVHALQRAPTVIQISGALVTAKRHFSG